MTIAAGSVAHHPIIFARDRAICWRLVLRAVERRAPWGRNIVVQPSMQNRNGGVRFRRASQLPLSALVFGEKSLE